MSPTSHPEVKLCTAQALAPSWIIGMIWSRSSGDVPAVANAITSPITSAGLAASCTSVWARMAISSPNRVETSCAWPGAPDVAQQRHPVDGLALLPLEPGLVGQPHAQQAGPQLRLERLAERVVLREREGRDQLTHSQRWRRHGALPGSEVRD